MATNHGAEILVFCQTLVTGSSLEQIFALCERQASLGQKQESRSNIWRNG